jgi:3-O-methylgallate 3,4-dioxygenase
MAEIVLGIGTGHAANLGFTPKYMRIQGEAQLHRESIAGVSVAELIRTAPPGIEAHITDEELQSQYEACIKGTAEIDRIMREVPFDVIVVMGDDQREQFNDEFMPTLAIFNGDEMEISERHRRTPAPGHWQENYREFRTSLPACPELANHLLESLVPKGFDLVRTNKLKPGPGLGHAFANIYNRYFLDREIPLVPIMVNCLFPPNRPTPERCYTLGRALRQSIEEWDSDLRVAIMGSGGMSHPILDVELDRMVLDAMEQRDTERLFSIPMERLIGNTGEILNWIVAAGALENMKMTRVGYTPRYRTVANTGLGCAWAYWLPE